MQYIIRAKKKKKDSWGLTRDHTLRDREAADRACGIALNPLADADEVKTVRARADESRESSR